ncbi:hypothetical protein D3C80_1590130 [compost metagenome]
MMVWKVFLPGASALEWLGSRLNSEPRFCRAMPLSGNTTPEPKPWYALWMNETMLPSPSAVAMYTVPLAWGSPCSGGRARSPICARRRAA